MTEDTRGRVVHVLSGIPYDDYVGRAMPRYKLNGSPYRNTYKVKDHGRQGALELYERKYRALLREIPGLEAEMLEIRGMTLACWCAPRDRALTLDDPEVCHGQVLLRLAQELSDE